MYKIFINTIILIIIIYFPIINFSKTNENCHYNCRDGKENLVEGKSDFKSKYPVKIKRLRGKLYRSNKLPACNENRATVLMPGIVKLLDGEMFVPNNNYDLIKSGIIKMTVNSPNFEKPICLNGKSQYIAMPNSWCTFILCEFIGNDLCKLLQTPGIHTIKELENILNFNSTLLLPDPPGLFGITLLDLLSGEFSFSMELETEGNIIAQLNIPTNQKYLQIGLDNTFTEEC